MPLQCYVVFFFSFFAANIDSNFLFQMPTSFFYSRRGRSREYLVPNNAEDSEAEMAEEDEEDIDVPSMSILQDIENMDDDILDPDFLLDDSMPSDEDESSTSSLTPAQKRIPSN